MGRIGWIDFLRGISMILILVFHTEVYYKEYDVTPYYIYTTNAIVLFYFVSGYLFYRQGKFQWQKRLKTIIFSLLLPYFIFTTLIAIPKLIIRQNEIDYYTIAVKIILGQASWFIAALIVAELFFSTFLWITRGKHLWLSIVSVTFFTIYYLIPFNQYNYWQWQDALLAFSFLHIGYLYHQYERYFQIFNNLLYSSIFLLIIIAIKFYEYNLDLPMRNIAIENVPLFLTDTIIWLFLIVSIIKFIPRCQVIEWTGRHCIVYYFLCGGCPLIISMLMNKIKLPYDGYFSRYLLTLFIVYVFATILTWLIYRYVPFITGKAKK